MKFVSVDGGATKTIAVTYDQSGEILGVGVKGSSNFRNVGIENANESVRGAIESSLEHSSLRWSDVDFFTFAVAGVKDSARSTAIIENFIASYNLEGKYSLLNDGEAGYRCRFPDRDGIIAAPGTGMIAFGRNGGGFERCSGWGWLIGDEGGAFYIGRRSIQESARLADGRSEENSEFLGAIMEFFNVTEPRMLVNEVYSNPINIRRIASIATLVSRLAKRGNDVALRLLKEAATESARCVISLQRKMVDGSNLPVSGYGGVFRSGEIYWDRFRYVISEEFSNTEFEKPLFGYHAVLGSMQTVLSKNGLEMGTEELNELAGRLDKKVMKLPDKDRKEYLLMD